MYLDKIGTYNVILGSQSPRRAFLLTEAGINFKQESRDVDESFPPDLENEDIVLFLARKKAKAFKESITDKDLLITADTIVIFDGDVLGKPANVSEARQLLSKLSAKKHTVFTGVCIMTKSKTEVFFARTEVTFKFLSSAEIDYYIENYQPFDKAGAYGIQEWFGYVCVEKINGSYTNVMGLPVKQLCEHLNNF